MAGERTQGAIEILDRRTSGVNFAEAVAEINLKNVPVGNTELFFDEIQITGVSNVGNHVLAIGFDDGSLVLLRDGLPVFEPSKDNLFIIKDRNEDFSRLIVSEKRADFTRGIYLIDEEKPTCLESGKDAALVWHSEDFKTFWTSVRAFGGITSGTRFSYRRINDSTEYLKGFFVGRAFSEPSVVGVSADSSDLLWTARKGDREYLYKNENLLFKGPRVDVIASDGLDMVVYVVNRSVDPKYPDVSIYIGHGERKPKKIYKSMFRVYDHLANNDLSRVAFRVDHPSEKSAPCSLLFIVDDQFARSEPFDHLNRWEIEDDGHIVARVNRNGVERVITAPARKESGKRGEPPILQDETVA